MSFFGFSLKIKKKSVQTRVKVLWYNLCLLYIFNS